jgi:PAS domain S-box-containing protein
LLEVGSLVRAPISQTKSYSLSLLILGSKPIAKPTPKKLKLLADLAALSKTASKTMADILADPGNDITVPLSLAEVEKDIEKSAFAAFIMNADLCIASANQAAEKLTGISKAKLQGQSHAEIIPETAEAVHYLYRRALETMQSPPHFEIVVTDAQNQKRVFNFNVTPFSPTDTRDYFLLVVIDEITSLVRRTTAVSNAIERDHRALPPTDPSQMFLLETLVKRRAIRHRKSVTYLTLRSWRQPIREYQIKALRALKQNLPADFPKAIAKEIAEEVESLFGKAGFKAIVPMPCSHSSASSCLSLEIARALGQELSLPVIQAFIPQPAKGVSHPKENAKRPPLMLARIIEEPILLIDDVATSGAHIEEATKLLKPTTKAVMSIVWIGGDASDKMEED